MGMFRKASNASQHSGGSGGKNIKITKADEEHYKVRTGSVHDPILAAVNEAQPFESSAPGGGGADSLGRQSYSLINQQGMYDVFGKPIPQPDISNPTRARDERPLDTIRSFEYAITGDLSYKDRLETDQLGFRVRPDFPRFGANPYGNQQQQQPSASSYGQGYNTAPVHSFSGDQQAFEQGVYEAPVKTEGGQKKKKKGLFGRKK
ncbi:CYFA0S16e00232g1_1 [Cyberlindnera fabianii]|uniref:CYFA0S16e00232g1_1 n=1 Tax=Cyberlindnera fabianii TaxID=36022 RepID=A0A061B609_CYBFA|nr:CYFA0S16e00232g1_1 [Cyberlindnera fabianii]